MALPTRPQVKAAIVEWWIEPGRPKLPVLRARLSQLVTGADAVRSSVSARIVDLGPPTGLVLQIELSRWDVNGSPLAPISLQFDATDVPAGSQADFDDVVDDDSGKQTRREKRNSLKKLLGRGLV